MELRTLLASGLGKSARESDKQQQHLNPKP